MVKVRIPAPLRPKTDGEAELTVKAATLREAVDSVVEAHPGLREHLLSKAGELHRFVNYFVNKTNARELDGPDTALSDEDTVLVLPAVAGGQAGQSSGEAPAAQGNGSLSTDEMRFYGRHLILPEVGAAGQRKLKQGSVVVIGAGGLGAPALLYLAAAGVGRIGIVDPDVVDASNLHRQILYSAADEGEAKVQAAKQRLESLNPHIEIETYQERLTSENALAILDGYDVVVDGTDNFPTRYLTNDACVLLGKPNVHASIFRFEGQASLFWPEGGGPCYRCLYPEPPPPGLVPSCAEGGVLGVLPGTLGVLQATEAIKLLLDKGRSLTGRLVLYNALDASFDEVPISRDPACPICGDDPEITELVDYEAFCGLHAQAAAMEGQEISVHELSRRRGDEELFVLDVREPWEHEIVHLEEATLIPLNDLADRASELPQDKEIVVHCHSGARSAKATEFLRSLGLRAYNLEGGIEAWSREIEPEKPTY